MEAQQIWETHAWQIGQSHSLFSLFSGLMIASLPQCARAGQLDCIRLVPLPPSYLPCSVLSYFLPCCDKGACHKNCLTQWSPRLHHHAWHLYRVLGFELRSLDLADWVLPQPTVISFLLMLTPSHRTDEAHTFSFLSKLQWSCCTSFMNSQIHWVPPSGCLFADTLGLGKWKNCFPQVPDWWRKKKSSISWQVLHCAGSDRHSWTWKQRPHCPSIFCSTG